MMETLQPITDKIKAAKELITENFQHAFAFYIVTGAGIFLYRVAFTPNDQLNELSGTITGFITGTVVATVINYLYGTSKSSQDKNKLLTPPTGEGK
jgi:branched-subunit amino acid ABC-type transport system permease component